MASTDPIHNQIYSKPILMLLLLFASNCRLNVLLPGLLCIVIPKGLTVIHAFVTLHPTAWNHNSVLVTNVGHGHQTSYRQLACLSLGVKSHSTKPSTKQKYVCFFLTIDQTQPMVQYHLQQLSNQQNCNISSFVAGGIPALLSFLIIVWPPVIPATIPSRHTSRRESSLSHLFLRYVQQYHKL